MDQDKSEEEHVSKKQKKESSSVENQPTGTPRSLRVLDFAKTRGMEMKFLKENIETKSGSKRIFQTLPRYLRRRSMSHNLHRIPRRIRFLASLEVSGAQGSNNSTAEGNKGRYRKHKRRPSYILNNYSRRIKNSKKWMKTHIWHAKRMKMENIWNYLLPIYSTCDSKTRFIYRSLFQYPLGISSTPQKNSSKFISFLYDNSYYVPIFLFGSFPNVCSLFSSSSGKQSLLLTPISVSSYDNLWFARDYYLSGNMEGAAYLFSLSHLSNTWNLISPVSFIWNNTQNHLCLWVHPSAYEQMFTLLTEVGNIYKVKVESKADQLQKYTITAPLSSSSPFDKSIITQISTSLNSLANRDLQPEIEKQISQFSELPLAKETDSRIIKIYLPVSSFLNLTPISDKTSDDHVINIWNFSTLSTHSDSDFRHFRIEIVLSMRVIYSKHPCHSSKLSDSKLSSIGVTEWDIIIPPIPFIDKRNKTERSRSKSKLHMKATNESIQTLHIWHKLVKSGAKVIGLQDRINIYFELNIPYFPLDFPDTNSYEQYSKELQDKLFDEYSKRPKSKRINFQKLGVNYPFCCPWFSLSTNSNNSSSISSTLIQVERPIRPKYEGQRKLDTIDVVQTTVTMLERGKPLRFSVIYEPSEEQLKRLCEGRFEDKDHKEKCSPSQIIGYITSGEFSFLLGFGSGIGFCRSSSLKDLSNHTKSFLQKSYPKFSASRNHLASSLIEKITKPEEAGNIFFVFIRNNDTNVFYPAVLFKVKE